MREIKFRAWNPRHGGYMFYSHQSKGLGYLEFNSTSTVVGEDDGDQRYELKDVELMQYTGLKDKNGKEIYEGDIVKPVQTKGMRWKVAIVEYQRGEFVIVPKDTTLSFKTLTETGWRKIEVIGNIYENPELCQ